MGRDKSALRRPGFAVDPRYRAATESALVAIQQSENWGLQHLTTGRFVVLIGNLLYGAGAFIADYNVTHVKNPRWPPHARFHNGQTMTLGVCLAAASVYFAFKPTIRVAQIQDNMFSAALIGSLYCFAGLTAILYPGTHWHDPEYANGEAQKYLFSGVCLAMWLGYALELRNLRARYYPQEKKI